MIGWLLGLFLTVQPAFVLWGDIRTESAIYVLEYLRDTANPIIYIDSPGGHIDASLIIAGAIQAKGNVRCIVRGRAASGAFAVLQACARREMRAGSFLVTHEPRVLIGEPIDRVAARSVLKQLEERSEQWNGICRRRLNVTAAEYRSRVEGKDWRMDPAEALRVGAIDTVIP